MKIAVAHKELIYNPRALLFSSEKCDLGSGVVFDTFESRAHAVTLDCCPFPRRVGDHRKGVGMHKKNSAQSDEVSKGKMRNIFLLRTSLTPDM